MDLTRQLKFRTQPPKRTAEEAKDWMLFQLPNEKNPNIDKYALKFHKYIPEHPHEAKCGKDG
jgi:hypothetical protein